MPGGDRTGPQATGSMTGRGMGYCAGFDRPGTMNPGYDAGMRQGLGRAVRGGGRGWRNMYYATGLPGWARYGEMPMVPVPRFRSQWSADDEAAALRQQAEALEASLSDVKRRLDELAQSFGEE